MKTRYNIRADILAEDYRRLGTQRAVAESYGCSEGLVQWWMSRLGISTAYDRRGRGNPKWRGGRRKDKDGYVQVYTPDHPHRNVRNEVPEHRLVMERTLGRYLLPSEVVHHKNGIRDDNRPENLELIPTGGIHVYRKHREYRDVWGRLHRRIERGEADGGRRAIRGRAIEAGSAVGWPAQHQVTQCHHGVGG